VSKPFFGKIAVSAWYCSTSGILQSALGGLAAIRCRPTNPPHGLPSTAPTKPNANPQPNPIYIKLETPLPGRKIGPRVHSPTLEPYTVGIPPLVPPTLTQRDPIGARYTPSRGAPWPQRSAAPDGQGTLEATAGLLATTIERQDRRVAALAEGRPPSPPPGGLGGLLLWGV